MPAVAVGMAPSTWSSYWGAFPMTHLDIGPVDNEHSGQPPETLDAVKALSKNALRTGRCAIRVSFLATSVLGAMLLYFAWKDASLPTAIARSAGFVVIMAGVHFIGYRLWARQSAITQTSQASEHSPVSRTFLGLIHGLVGFFVSSFLMFSHLCDRRCPVFELPFILVVSAAFVLCVLKSSSYRSALKHTGLVFAVAVLVAFVYLTVLHL
jgi:hypothetical protein